MNAVLYKLLVGTMIGTVSSGTYATEKQVPVTDVTLSASCAELNKIEVGSAYISRALEQAMICKALNKVNAAQIETIVRNRVASFKAGDQAAIWDFNLTIDTYVLDTGDSYAQEVGRSLLNDIAVQKYDVDGRYRFLLGLSYLNTSCTSTKPQIVQNLESSTSAGNVLAAALLAYMYQNSYQCFEKDPVKYHAFLDLFEEYAESKASFADAVEYMKGKGILVFSRASEVVE